MAVYVQRGGNVSMTKKILGKPYISLNLSRTIFRNFCEFIPSI